MIGFATLLMIAASSAAAAPASRIVAAAGRWAALAGAGQCDAASLSVLPASSTRMQGRASLTFDARSRHGQFAAALSKPVAGGTWRLWEEEKRVDGRRAVTQVWREELPRS